MFQRDIQTRFDVDFDETNRNRPVDRDRALYRVAIDSLSACHGRESVADLPVNGRRCDQRRIASRFDQRWFLVRTGDHGDDRRCVDDDIHLDNCTGRCFRTFNVLVGRRASVWRRRPRRRYEVLMRRLRRRDRFHRAGEVAGTTLNRGLHARGGIGRPYCDKWAVSISRMCSMYVSFSGSFAARSSRA